MSFPPIGRYDVDQRQYKVPSKDVENMNQSRESRNQEHGVSKSEMESETRSSLVL
jgi:hypothetical protein